MAVTDLLVPFADKDEAKRLGARWNPETRVWYVPEGRDPAPFQKWVPQPPEINVRAASYFIAEGQHRCWKCHAQTPVFGFILGKNSQHRDYDDDDNPIWDVVEDESHISYVSYIPETVSARLRERSKTLTFDFSATTNGFYYMNHCSLCGMKQGDFEVQQEYATAFRPVDPEAASRATLYHVNEPFEGTCGSFSYDVELIGYMNLDTGLGPANASAAA